MPDRPTTVAELPSGPLEYRLERRGEQAVLVFHGGHTRAGLAMGEDAFVEADYTVLAPSRPGYGRTALRTAGTVAAFTDVTAALCATLGISRVTAAVGISGGGPTAVTMAARHPDLIERLLLISAVGWLPYPGRIARASARVIFHTPTEAIIWGLIHSLARTAPRTCLRLMLAGLSTRPAGLVMPALRGEDRETLLDLFAGMRSGSGFVRDLRPTPDVTADVNQPTLLIASRNDGGVPFVHSQSLARAIGGARLLESKALTHLIWLDPQWPDIAAQIRAFLGTAVTR